MASSDQISLLDKMKDSTLKQVLILFFILAPTLTGFSKGVWEFGVDQKWWGKGKGQSEQINLILAKKNIMSTPTNVIRVIDEETDKLELRVYPTGDVLVIRHIATVDGEHQRMTWLPRQNPEKILESKLWRDNLAYAMDGQYKVNMFTDEVIEWIDDYHVQIKRTNIETKCWEVVVVDVTNGHIIEILEEGCPDVE